MKVCYRTFTHSVKSISRLLGTHLRIPWFETPIDYDVRAKPRNVASLTGTKDLQMVNITCRVLSRPRVEALPQIYRTLGTDYDERVLPSIVNEVLGGWRLAATSRENTGAPFTPTMANNISWALSGAQYPNLIGNPKVAHKSIDNWFNKDAYGFNTSCQVTNGQNTCGYGLFGNVRRNSLNGPDYTNLNLSFGKTFDLFELSKFKSKFEVRADAQNALNHAAFSGPDSSIGDGKNAEIRGLTDGGRHIQLYGKFTF